MAKRLTVSNGEIRDAERYCEECGADLASTDDYCPNCGAQL